VLAPGVTFFFVLLDRRNQELVRAAERALKVCEARLAAEAGIEEMTIIAKTDEQTCFLMTHRTILPSLQSIILLGFGLMAAIALVKLLDLRIVSG
jgi:hypothetical protein